MTSTPTQSVPAIEASQGPSPVERARAADVLTGLQRVMNGAALFSIDHPAVLAAAAACAEHVNTATRAGRLELAVGAKGFLLRGEALDNTETLQVLAERLGRRLVIALAFEPGATAQDIAGWCAAIVAADKDHAAPQALQQSASTASNAKINLSTLVCERLAFSDGPREGPAPSGGAGLTWDALADHLLRGLGSQSGATPATASRDWSAALTSMSRPEIARLRERLSGLTNAAPSQAWPDSIQTEERVRGFVGSLSPQAREALVCVGGDGGDPAPALRFLAQFGHQMPAGEVVSVLESIGASSKAATPEALRLFSVLARTTTKDAADWATFGRTLKSWVGSTVGAPNPVAIDNAGIDADLRDSLQDILQAGGSERFTPEEYQAIIARATAGLSAAREAIGKYHIEPSDTRLHAGEIAATLLRDGGKASTPGLIHRIERSLDELLAAARFDCLAWSVRAAKAIDASAGKDLPAAAASLLGAIAAPERMRTVLDARARAIANTDDIALLLSVGGAGALEAMLTASEASDGTDLAPLRPMFEPLDAVARLKLLEALDTKSPHAAARLVRLASMDSLSIASPLLERALASPSADVRREAFTGLSRGGGAWTERLATAAITDADATIVQLGLRGACRDLSSWSTSLLAGFLAGRLGPASPTRQNMAEAAATLAQRGEEGREVLAAVLEFLGWRIGNPRARLAGSLADALQPYRQERRVRRAMGRWQRSPARLIARLQGPSNEPTGRAAA